MTNELFTIRDARPDDKAVLDGYANLEGMDAIPSIEGVRVAVNEDDEVVGFLRIALAEDGTAFVNPVITHETWRGFGVGRALMEEALARHGELRLVSRGGSLPSWTTATTARCATNADRCRCGRCGKGRLSLHGGPFPTGPCSGLRAQRHRFPKSKRRSRRWASFALCSRGGALLMRAQRRVGEVDAQSAGGEAAELFEGELVAGQGVDPPAQAAAALVGE